MFLFAGHDATAGLTQSAVMMMMLRRVAAGRCHDVIHVKKLDLMRKIMIGQWKSQSRHSSSDLRPQHSC